MNSGGSAAKDKPAEVQQGNLPSRTNQLNKPGKPDQPSQPSLTGRQPPQQEPQLPPLQPLRQPPKAWGSSGFDSAAMRQGSEGPWRTWSAGRGGGRAGREVSGRFVAGGGPYGGSNYGRGGVYGPERQGPIGRPAGSLAPWGPRETPRQIGKRKQEKNRGKKRRREERRLKRQKTEEGSDGTINEKRTAEAGGDEDEEDEAESGERSGAERGKSEKGEKEGEEEKGEEGQKEKKVRIGIGEITLEIDELINDIQVRYGGALRRALHQEIDRSARVVSASLCPLCEEATHANTDKDCPVAISATGEKVDRLMKASREKKEEEQQKIIKEISKEYSMDEEYTDIEKVMKRALGIYNQKLKEQAVRERKKKEEEERTRREQEKKRTEGEKMREELDEAKKTIEELRQENEELKGGIKTWMGEGKKAAKDLETAMQELAQEKQKNKKLEEALAKMRKG